MTLDSTICRFMIRSFLTSVLATKAATWKRVWVHDYMKLDTKLELLTAPTFGCFTAIYHIVFNT